MGNTLGEMSLTYYRYVTSAQASLSVFMADQPEDNISNNRVSSHLTDYFNGLRLRSQVIIVTHSPLDYQLHPNTSHIHPHMCG